MSEVNQVENNKFFKLMKDVSSKLVFSSEQEAEDIFSKNVTMIHKYNMDPGAMEIAESYKPVVFPLVIEFENGNSSADELLTALRQLVHYAPCPSDLHALIKSSLQTMLDFFNGSIEGMTKQEYASWLYKKIDDMNAVLTAQ